MDNNLIKLGKSSFNLLKSFKHIFIFFALFLCFEILWKLAVHEGAADESILLIFGKDFTAYTKGISVWTAKLTHWIVYSLFGYTDFKIDGITIFFEKSLYVNVIWGCTGLKQFFMFTFILLLYPGPIKKKLWFLPLSLFILLLVNLFRLAFICLIIKDGYPDWFIPFNEWYNNKEWTADNTSFWMFYKDWFNLFHRDIFKWIYYDGLIFLLWLTWEEKIRKPFAYKRSKILDKKPT